MDDYVIIKRRIDKYDNKVIPFRYGTIDVDKLLQKPALKEKVRFSWWVMNITFLGSGAFAL